MDLPTLSNRLMFPGGALLALTLCGIPATAGIYQDALRATVRLTAGPTSGTAFLVKLEGKPVHAMVTAAHVFRDMPGGTCTVVFRKAGEAGGFERHEVELAIRKEKQALWKKHEKMDVAVIGIELPAGVDTRPFSLEDIATADLAAEGKIGVGTAVCMACFPAKLEANRAGWPILRRGSIATHPLTPLAAAKTFFVDSSSFGGDSGAPVVAEVEGKTSVVGLITSMQRQTDKSKMPFEERTVHTPLGLGIAVQAPFIREVVEAWVMQELREGVVGSVSGTVQCAKTTDKPEYWRE